jgi:hypothetical protein
VEIYEDDSLTQITSAETLTVDFDALVGLNHLRIVATAANGFESGKSYSAVITSGTVGGVSVVGEVIYNFSIGRSAAAVDLANGTDGLGALKTVVDAILVDTGTTLQAELDGIQVDTEDIQSRLPAALVSGRIDASVGAMAANVLNAAAIATDAIGASELAADAVNEIRDAILDRVLSGNHTTVGTVGAALFDTDGDVGNILVQVLHGTWGLAAIQTLISALNTLVDTRLTSARAGYLDELAAANLPADLDTLLARLSSARAGYLDELAAANLPADLAALLVEIAKVPRLGQTYKHRNVISNEEADVIIEPAS